MTNKLDERLCAKYPEIFRDRHGDMRKTAMCWGINVGDGWFSILDNLCGFIQRRIKSIHPAPPQVVALQIKTKFGGLRFYYRGGDDVIRGAVDFSEYLADRTCDGCGETDPNLVGSVRNGWLRTCCEDCVDPARLETAGWKSLAALARAFKRREATKAKKGDAVKPKGKVKK